MSNFIHVEGRNVLCGATSIDGSKNSVLLLLPAICFGQGEGILYNVPKISDVEDMVKILNEIGMDVNIDGDAVQINGTPQNCVVSDRYASRIRASSLFLGVLLATLGEVTIPLPGGDKIGERPVDIHQHVLSCFGIHYKQDGNCLKCKAAKRTFRGANVFLRYPSVGATANALLLAVSAESDSVISNAAMEPEIVELAILLNLMGARIYGAGTPIIHIKPARRLVRVQYSVMPDRLETGTYMFMISTTQGYGELLNVVPEHMTSVISTLKNSGVKIYIKEKSIIVDATKKKLRQININALPYPGFPSDLQPFAFVFGLVCDGKSVIKDSVHQERFSYLSELYRMGAQYDHSYDKVYVQGVQKIGSQIVEGTDIRMTAALIQAALIADGETHIYGVRHVERGYGDICKKLSELNAKIEKV